LSKSRELIIAPQLSRGQLVKFLADIEKDGIKIVNIDPATLTGIKTKLATIHSSQNAANRSLEDQCRLVKTDRELSRVSITSTSCRFSFTSPCQAAAFATTGGERSRRQRARARCRYRVRHQSAALRRRRFVRMRHRAIRRPA
jgi:hypothetical protein